MNRKVATLIVVFTAVLMSSLCALAHTDLTPTQAKAFIDVSEDAPSGAYAEQSVTDFAARDIIYNYNLRTS